MKRTQRLSHKPTYFKDPSKADQSQKKACDVNEIVNRYMKTGEIFHITKAQGLYQDVSNIPDLMEATNQVNKAREAFEALPAELRKKLDHDPANLIEFLNNPENDKEAIKYGLKEKRPEAPKEEPVADRKAKKTKDTPEPKGEE